MGEKVQVGSRELGSGATLCPAAVHCQLADCEQLTSYLRFPAEHHNRIQHSNFIKGAAVSRAAGRGFDGEP